MVTNCSGAHPRAAMQHAVALSINTAAFREWNGVRGAGAKMPDARRRSELLRACMARAAGSTIVDSEAVDRRVSIHQLRAA